MQDFIAKLKNEMKKASDSLEYEKAKEIRDTLQRLGSLQNDQKMEYVENAPNEDYFGIKIEDQTALIMSLKQTNGVIRDRERFSFDLVADNTFSNFLYQYYTTHKIPKYIITSETPQQKDTLEKMLSKNAGKQVSIIIPKQGKRKKMIDLVMKNIELIQSSGTEPGLVELQEILKLKKTPKIMECFDISNHGADYAVGAMSRFVDGTPDKSGYRKFKIKTVKGRDDYAMISEVIKRRYLRLLNEEKKLPDLVVIDGGKGQLSAALKSFQSISLNIPCISLAKQNEEIFKPGERKSIIIEKNKSSLKILQHIRDEAHRFGVAYNRKLREINR